MRGEVTLGKLGWNWHAGLTRVYVAGCSYPVATITELLIVVAMVMGISILVVVVVALGNIY